MFVVWSIQGNKQHGVNKMTYSESAEGITITKARAYKELMDHGHSKEDWLSFLLDIIADEGTVLDEEGSITHMEAGVVMTWLGY